MMFGFRELRESEQGTSLIEMALVAPFLAALLVGMIDISKAYSDKLMLEQAAQRTIERVQQQRSVSSDYSSLKVEAATAAGVQASQNNPVVRQWLECTPTDGNGTVTGAPVSQGNNSLGNQCPSDTDLPARYVTITIQKAFTPIMRSRYLGTNANGTYTLTGQAGIRIQ